MQTTTTSSVVQLVMVSMVDHELFCDHVLVSKRTCYQGLLATTLEVEQSREFLNKLLG